MLKSEPIPDGDISFKLNLSIIPLGHMDCLDSGCELLTVISCPLRNPVTEIPWLDLTR